MYPITKFFKKPPVVAENVHSRYAQILFSIASKNEKISTVHEDFKNLNQYFEKSEKLRSFIDNKTFNKTEQKDILNTITKGLDSVTLNFLDTVLENRKLHLLRKIIKEYDHYIKLQNKEEAIKVISAYNLSKDEQKMLQASLTKKYGHSNFNVEYDVNPGILGGLQIYFGNTFLDCSLTSRLNKIQSEVRNMNV